MKQASDITACVIDNGIFFNVAQTLARQCKRVLYHVPLWQRGFPTIHDGAIGDGFDEVELVHDFWGMLNEIDLFVFPDIQHSGLQLHLEYLGHPVWGAKKGDSLEINRQLFLRTLGQVGLQVPEHKLITGLDALRKYLRPLSDKFVKISRWRKDLETFHWLDWDLSSSKLDELAIRFGPLQNTMPFLVFEPIDADAEVGYDGYCVGGQWPARSAYGVESKDKAYLGTMKEYKDLPKQVREVNEALAPVLGRYGYCNFFSSEIRISGDDSYFIDPTCRLGMPSGDAQLALYSNLAEIIWNGASGEIVDPKPIATFCAQALIDHHGDHEKWRVMEIPDKAYDNVRLLYPCKVGKETYAACPTGESGDIIGSIHYVADSIEGAINGVKEIAEMIEHNDVCVHTAHLMDVLKDIEASEEHGVEFTDETVPEPESVL